MIPGPLVRSHNGCHVLAVLSESVGWLTTGKRFEDVGAGDLEDIVEEEEFVQEKLHGLLSGQILDFQTRAVLFVSCPESIAIVSDTLHDIVDGLLIEAFGPRLDELA